MDIITLRLPADELKALQDYLSASPTIDWAAWDRVRARIRALVLEEVPV